MNPIICAWCGKTMRHGDPACRPSHGICVGCLQGSFPIPVESVDSLTPEQLDCLPRGLVRLSQDGRIRFYNQAESRLSGLDAAQVIGEDFFAIAPCTAVKEFRGEFDSLVAAGAGERNFGWIFEFPGGKTYVNITMTKDANDPFVSLFVMRAG